MPRVAQDGVALSAHPGDHQCGAGADVRDPDLGAVETARPVHDRVQPALDGDAGAHLGQLAHVLEAVFVHVLGDDALTVSLGHERHVLGLQVGRKTGKRPGRHVDRSDRRERIARHAKPFVARFDPRACLLELEEEHLQVVGLRALDAEVTSCRRDRDGVSSGLKVIGHDGVLGAAQVGTSIDDQALGADALDMRAHLREQQTQVLDVRLAGGVEDLGASLGLDRREQDVLGPRHGREVEDDAVAVESVG